MAIDTSKLAPRIIINEHELPNPRNYAKTKPVTLIFGFAPLGKTLEMVVCNNAVDITNEFGYPSSAAEKYFIDAGMRVVNEGATALMTRLPYDNFAQHNVKYVDYHIEDPIAIKDISTGPKESMVRE